MFDPTPKLGKFIDEDNNALQIAEPAPDEAFAILCGPWPNPNEGAIHRLCANCNEAIGVSPKGIAYHDALPDFRPLLCQACFTLLIAIRKLGLE
jgi:hypothetical protein